MVLMKEPLSHKSEIRCAISWWYSLGCSHNLNRLRTAQVKGLTTCCLSALPSCESLLVLQVLNVSTLLEIKDKMNLNNISGSKQKLLALGRIAWYRLMKFVIRLSWIPVLALTRTSNRISWELLWVSSSHL